ncbi:hypothetical protein NE237_005683 [Protea cynaroides]|uniref:Uncharacterized protein n=1 Tax=Protea cynaroides TaxID=273540 RepID=A0A9Q0QUT0_9MAGN|nr:hypothetical protein NE237_005683 [Protea cynaroides]
MEKSLDKWGSTHNAVQFHYPSGMQVCMLTLRICAKVRIFGFGKSAEAMHHYHIKQKAELDLHGWPPSMVTRHYLSFWLHLMSAWPPSVVINDCELPLPQPAELATLVPKHLISGHTCDNDDLPLNWCPSSVIVFVPELSLPLQLSETLCSSPTTDNETLRLFTLESMRNPNLPASDTPAKVDDCNIVAPYQHIPNALAKPFRQTFRRRLSYWNNIIHQNPNCHIFIIFRRFRKPLFIISHSSPDEKSHQW